MRLLDLFSGIGGFSLGLERAGFRTVAFCESNPKCRTVLARHWPGVPLHADVRTIPRIGCDIIAAGFPCQPFSTAARGRNNAADLWPAALDVIRAERPAWVVAENVPGIGHGGVDRVCGDLEAEGYACWPFDLDTALPQRQRMRARFIWLAHADRQGEPRRPVNEKVAGLCAIPRRRETDHCAPVGMDDGLSRRMDRLRQLGNAVTPFAAELIGRAIMRAASEATVTP
jgi:DNA (cytosine-5)-methyltransferase 1